MKDEVEPNAAVEIHDSTLERIERRGDGVVAVISAYVHRSAGRPGVDAGTGWSQTLELRFAQGRTNGSLEAIPMELLDGHLDVAGEKFANMIPMPLDRIGSTRLELHSWNDAKIVIEGDRVTGSLIGPARYIEEFAANGGLSP
jgi:hypothetical protein